jgi:hypothetical protein
MTNRAHFLASIANDDGARAVLVEDLRCAAAMLDGSAPDFGEATNIKSAFRIAAKLRDAAQRLCDHTRATPDGRCRYCEALMGVEEH